MTNSRPTISVVVAIYNASKYLAECIDSILAQTYADFELILVNDGSKDNSLDIMEKYAEKDSRIQIIDKSNGGYGSAMNAGIDIARGDYLAIVEPDDLIKPDMFKVLIGFATKLTDKTIDIVKSKISSFTNDDTSTEHVMAWEKTYPIPSGDVPFKIKEYPWLLAVHPSTVTCLYRIDFLKKHNIKYVEAKGAGWVDNPFQVQTMCLAENILFINESYYLWRNHETNSSAGLTDYTLPVQRTKEIHDWLYANNLYDDVLLANLYKRELSYIKQMLDMKTVKDTDFNDYCYQIEVMTKRMKETLVLDNDTIKPGYKLLYKVCKQNAELARAITPFYNLMCVN